MTVAFSGHRPQKIRNFSSSTEQQIRDFLHRKLNETYLNGYRCFLSGMAPGFDLWAADEVLKLRSGKNYKDILLHAVVPYPDFFKSFDDSSKLLYQNVIRQADKTIYIADNYHRAVYSRRNDYLIANSSLLICYYEGASGGTRYTVKQAVNKGIGIINLFNPDLFSQIYK